MPLLDLSLVVSFASGLNLFEELLGGFEEVGILFAPGGGELALEGLFEEGLAIDAEFPIPPLPEQREIVRLLDEQFTVIEQNEREIDAALKRSAALRQSILKKAFTGQLVPQDLTDEPTSALLERIRNERKATTPKTKGAPPDFMQMARPH